MYREGKSELDNQQIRLNKKKQTSKYWRSVGEIY